MKLKPEKYYLNTIEQLIAEANQDSDPASGWWLGDCIHSADGAIFIVKGNEAANKAYNLLCNHGLVTPGKPVIDPKPKKKGNP